MVEKFSIYNSNAELIIPAGHREWIPVEGLEFPKVDVWHNLSAGIQVPIEHLPYVGLHEPNTGGIEALAHAVTEVRLHELQGLSEDTCEMLNVYSGQWRERSADQTLFALAPNNDTLYEKVIIPVINNVLKQQGLTQVLIPHVGYPIVSWFKEGLEMAKNNLTEANYFNLIGQGTLPPEIGAVYIDFPGTFFSAAYDPILVRTWIEKNPEVLFIVDQANLGFNTGGDSTEALFDIGLIPPDATNVIATYTTTKAFSVRAFAQAWSSKKFTQEFSPASSYHVVPMTDQTDIALNLLRPSNLMIAHTLKQQIITHREELKWRLQEVYGDEAVYNAHLTQGHALIINAPALGFTHGLALTAALADGAGRKDGIPAVPIAVKPTLYYGDTMRYPSLNDYIYLSVPFNGEVQENVKFALQID